MNSPSARLPIAFSQPLNRLVISGRYLSRFSRIACALPAVHEHLCESLVRFLRECLDLHRPGPVAGVLPAGHLDVAVVAVRSCRAHPHGHKHLVLPCIVKRTEHCLPESLLVFNHLVGRGDHGHGIRIALEQGVGRVCDARGGVPAVRLNEQVLRKELRHFPEDSLPVPCCRDDDDVLRKNELREPLVRAPDESLSRVEDFKELLRAVCPAQRPETCSRTSRQYDAVLIAVHI